MHKLQEVYFSMRGEKVYNLINEKKVNENIKTPSTLCHHGVPVKFPSFLHQRHQELSSMAPMML